MGILNLFKKQTTHKICCARCKRVILPKTLFKLYDISSDSLGDSVSQYWADVIIDKCECLCVEENWITYCAHNIAHNTGRRTTCKRISFEKLPALIAVSCDSNAAKYSGMNQTNWKEYIKEPKDVKKRLLVTYPKITFGKYEWYVLEQENDIMMLLSKHEIDTSRWNTEEKGVNWKERTLCPWLNTDFIKEDFTNKEQQAFVRFDDGTRVSLFDYCGVRPLIKVDRRKL